MRTLFHSSMQSPMPEREAHDPVREARELGARIAERINNEKGATRTDAFRDRDNLVGPHFGAEVGASLAVSEKYRDDGNEELERHEGKENRKGCLAAILKKLTRQGTPIPPDLQEVLRVVMERVPGQWDQYYYKDQEGEEYDEYDGEVRLGKVTFDTLNKAITINFEFFGQTVGEQAFRLALT